LKVLGVTLARGGSKGVPKKNIKLLNNKPLIAYTIEAALDSDIFTNYIVSTDSEEIAEIASQYGAEVPFMRPGELAQDHIWSRDALKHAVLECEEVYDIKYDYVIELPCVAPLRNSIHIREAFDKLVETGCDSVTSFSQVHDKHPIRMKRIFNDDISDCCKEFPEGEGTRRQDLAICYIRNGAIFAMTRNCIVENFSRHGKNCKPYIMNELESVNIDTMIDFKLAELLLKENES